VAVLVAERRAAAATEGTALLAAFDQVDRRRPTSVIIALAAGALAVFIETRYVVTTVNSLFFLGRPWLRPAIETIFFNPWWVFALVWIGLVVGSCRAWRIARLGSALAAIALCNFGLSEQMALWGPSPSGLQVLSGTLYVALRSVPLLVVFASLMTESAERYYRA
jgi:hypothetical protein